MLFLHREQCSFCGRKYIIFFSRVVGHEFFVRHSKNYVKRFKNDSRFNETFDGNTLEEKLQDMTDSMRFVDSFRDYRDEIAQLKLDAKSEGAFLHDLSKGDNIKCICGKTVSLNSLSLLAEKALL